MATGSYAFLGEAVVGGAGAPLLGEAAGSPPAAALPGEAGGTSDAAGRRRLRGRGSGGGRRRLRGRSSGGGGGAGFGRRRSGRRRRRPHHLGSRVDRASPGGFLVAVCGSCGTLCDIILPERLEVVNVLLVLLLDERQKTLPGGGVDLSVVALNPKVWCLGSEGGCVINNFGPLSCALCADITPISCTLLADITYFS
jgi:hypothetical protein